MSLAISQSGVLVHELAHLYLGEEGLANQLGGADDEKYGLRDAVALGAREQRRNAASFAYFYNCEWEFYVFFVCDAGEAPRLYLGTLLMVCLQYSCGDEMQELAAGRGWRVEKVRKVLTWDSWIF